MIRSLRRKHLATMIVLAFVLALVFIAGMLARPRWPAQNKIEPSHFPATTDSTGGQR